MRRWALVLALLLSLGVNVGILATLALRRAVPPAPPPAAGPVNPPRDGEGRPYGPGDPGGPGDLYGPGDPRGPGEPGGLGEPGGDTPPRVMRLADHLGLEGEPRRRFVQLQGRFFGETLRLRTEHAEVLRELRRELMAADPDPLEIEELTRLSARLHLQMEQAMARNVIATRELLDPAQERRYLEVLSRIRLGPGGNPPDRQRGPWPRRQPRRDERPAPRFDQP